MVLKERLAEDVTVNVLLELDTVGEEDIRTQVLKLSEETCRVPVQDVPDEFVVTEVVSIDSEKVTEIENETETDVSEVEVEEIFGAVVSIPPFVPAIVYLSKVSSFLAHEYTISRISPEIRLVFIIDSSEKETDTK
jgi:hypothetical protein